MCDKYDHYFCTNLKVFRLRACYCYLVKQHGCSYNGNCHNFGVSR